MDQIAAAMSDLNSKVNYLRSKGYTPDQIRQELTDEMNVQATQQQTQQQQTQQQQQQNGPNPLTTYGPMAMSALPTIAGLAKTGAKIPQNLLDLQTNAQRTLTAAQMDLSALPQNATEAQRLAAVTAVKNAQQQVYNANDTITRAQQKPSAISKITSNPGVQGAAAGLALFEFGKGMDSLVKDPTAGKALGQLVAGVGGVYALHAFLINPATMSALTSILGTNIMTFLTPILTNPFFAIGVGVFIAVLTILKALKQDVPQTANGKTMQSFTDDLPPLLDSLPTGVVTSLVAGAALMQIGFTSSPTDLYKDFPNLSTTVVLTALQNSGAQGLTAGTLGNRIFKVPGATPSDPSRMILITPNLATGTSDMQVFSMNSDGYVLGPNGPDKTWGYLFNLKTDSTGKVTGYSKNPNGLNMFKKQAAALALANDPTASIRDQQAATLTAGSADHDPSVAAP